MHSTSGRNFTPAASSTTCTLVCTTLYKVAEGRVRISALRLEMRKVYASLESGMGWSSEPVNGSTASVRSSTIMWAAVLLLTTGTCFPLISDGADAYSPTAKRSSGVTVALIEIKMPFRAGLSSAY